MILDTIQNINHYAFGGLFNNAFQWLSQNDVEHMATGKYLIEGEQLFAMVNEYETSDQNIGIREGHIKYIDLQVMISGTEQVAWELKSRQTVSTPYDPDRDYAFFDAAEQNLFKFEVGMFAVFYPHDLHMPNLIHRQSQAVRKVVFKIIMNE